MKKILFFVNGFAPSGEDLKEAAKVEGQVLYRNVQLFDDKQPLEKCDGVAGCAPSQYLEKFKTIKPQKFVEKKEV